MIPRFTWPTGISQELQYVLLLFVLFVLPRALQRFRIPSAVTCVLLGAGAGMGLGVLHDDPTIGLLAILGIVSLFLFAGLEADFRELRRHRAMLIRHVLIGVALLALTSYLAVIGLGVEPRAGVLIGLAVTTPSTGFILDSLAGMGLDDAEGAWIKSKAIATEVVALLALVVVLQPPDAGHIAISLAVMVAMIAVLPWVFRFFAAIVLPYAPKSEFAFLLMVAVFCALVTRQLGAYYLVGAFVVGVTAQRFRERMPAMASEKMVHAVEVFASFFVPFYFFHAGLQFTPGDFTFQAALLGAGLVVAAVPLRVLVVAAHRRVALGEPMPVAARIGTALVPTLVFTLVIAELLKDRFGLAPDLFGALMVYTIVNTLIPGFVLGPSRVAFVEPRAPELPETPPA